MEEVDFLIVNPWIYDFAAYDFWLKPYGLLLIAGKLQALGYKIAYIDLLDPFHPELPKKPKRRAYGTGHFFKSPIPKPYYFLDVPRRFFRYGLPFEVFEKEVNKLKFKAVLTSCTLTYWYPGLVTLLQFFSSKYPETQVFVGGIYVKLCFSHIKKLIEEQFKGAKIDLVNYELEEFLEKLKKNYIPSGKKVYPDYPAFYLQREIPYVVIMTSFGCPFNCPYCASKRIYPEFKLRDPEEVFQEILFWYKNFSVVDFAFYDDALLFNFDNHLGVILDKVLSSGIKVRFHTPNAIHARFVNKEVAKMLKLAGFETIRIGLERVENRFDNKVSIEEFLQAIACLREAGFKPRQIGAYMLYGIPEEDFSEVERGLKFLDAYEVPPYLAEYSPIPGTPFFEKAKQTSRYPIEEDPIFHNNSVFPALKNPDWERIKKVKDLAKSIRHRLSSLS